MHTRKYMERGFVIESLEISVASTTVTLSANGASVNGQMSDRPYADDVLYVKKASATTYMVRLFGVVITHDTSGTNLQIKVSPYYSDMVSIAATLALVVTWWSVLIYFRYTGRAYRISPLTLL